MLAIRAYSDMKIMPIHRIEKVNAGIEGDKGNL